MTRRLLIILYTMAFVAVIWLLSGCAIFRTDPMGQPSNKVIRKALNPNPVFINDKINILPIGYYGLNCVFYLPANYDETKAYPLVIFNHGMGEAGSDINKLYNQGLPQVLKGGYKPPFDFIMIAAQHSSYSPEPWYLAGMLKDVEKRYKIDTTRIYITGLSAGGYGTYGSQFNIDTELAKKFAAVVVLSGATQDINRKHFDWLYTTKTPIWAIVGNNDVSYRDQNINMTDSINKKLPGLALLSIRQGIGHGNWNDIYNGSYKPNGMDMWQWLYQFTRGEYVEPSPIPIPTPPTFPVWKVGETTFLIIGYNKADSTYTLKQIK